MNRLIRKVLFLLPLMIWIFPCVGAQQDRVGNTAPYALYKAGNFTGAIRRARKLIAKDRENISAYAVMGLSYLALRQWRNAIDSAQNGYRRSPRDLRILAVLGEGHYELQQDEKAMEYLSKYITYSNRGTLRPWIYYFIGSIFQRADKLYKADISLSTAVRLDPSRVRWWLQLAEIKEHQSDAEQALDIYRKVLTIDSNNQIARRKIQQKLLAD